VSGEVSFQNTATGTRITTKSMADYTIQKFLPEKNLHFFTFYKKTDKPVKSIIRYLPGNTCTVNITVAPHDIDYDSISAKQMTAKRATPEGGVKHISLSLFVVILARNQKAPEIFKLTTL
jgi:hypothetical protein